MKKETDLHPKSLYSFPDLACIFGWTRSQICKVFAYARKLERLKYMNNEQSKLRAYCPGEIINRYIREHGEPETGPHKKNQKPRILEGVPSLPKEYVGNDVAAGEEPNAVKRIYEIAEVLRSKRQDIKADVKPNQAGGIRLFSGKMIGQNYVFKQQ